MLYSHKGAVVKNIIFTRPKTESLDTPIKMVDLSKQYLRLKSDIDNAIQQVLDSTQFIKGPQVKSFESNLSDYMQCKHVISCANGTDALQIAMMALNLQPGDEVITASFTYVATAEVIALLKLKPVLVDVNTETFTINPEAIRNAITPRTKAIVPVHLFGQCADMESILKIAEEHGLYVIEDNAQAIGATYTFSDGRQMKSGTMGTIGTTSFFPSKNLGCFGDGGALNTNDDSLATKIRCIANHGQTTQYVHDMVGINSRLDTLQAAILDVKLRHLDDFAKRRNEVAKYYDAAFKNLSGVKTPERAKNSTHVFHQYTLTLEGINRDLLRQELEKAGIPSMVYYPIPLHHQKAYLDKRYEAGMFPVTEKLCSSVISLPIHTEFTSDQLNYITDNFIYIINQLK